MNRDNPNNEYNNFLETFLKYKLPLSLSIFLASHVTEPY